MLKIPNYYMYFNGKKILHVELEFEIMYSFFILLQALTL